MVFCQDADLKTSKIDSCYTWRNSTVAERDSFYFGLPIIKSSINEVHIRISFGYHVIDLFSKDGISYEGRLNNIISEYKLEKSDYGEISREYQYVYQTNPIKDEICAEIGSFLISSGQFENPTDTLIDSWNKWYLHCGSLQFQWKVGDDYSEQKYHCPWSQEDTVEYKKEVVQIYEMLTTKLELKAQYDSFIEKLPLGKTYSSDGYRMLYKMTPKETKSWTQSAPIRDYLKSLKDTIDTCINTELSKQDLKLGKFGCFHDFQITIGINGKLKRVDIPREHKPELYYGIGFYIEDWMELLRCKMEVKKLLKSLNLEFLLLKYEVKRVLNFNDDGSFYLRDNTIY